MKIFAIFLEYSREKNMVDVIFCGSTVGSHRVPNEVLRKEFFIACCSSFDIMVRIEYSFKLFLPIFAMYINTNDARLVRVQMGIYEDLSIYRSIYRSMLQNQDMACKSRYGTRLKRVN